MHGHMNVKYLNEVFTSAEVKNEWVSCSPDTSTEHKWTPYFEIYTALKYLPFWWIKNVFNEE
jgi:hypothetical protein